MKTKLPVYIMVFSGFTSDGDIIPPSIFSHGLGFNTEPYIKCLEEVVLAWIQRVTAGRPYVYQQVFAPCYTSKRNQYWMRENFCNHISTNICLPNSTDFNSLDYHVWDKTPCNTKDEVKARITAAFNNLNKKTVGKNCRRFGSRLEALVEVNGDFFE